MSLKNFKMSSTVTQQQPDCAICCESFTKALRSKVKCGHCNLEACKQCVRTYLMGTSSGAHCMGCKNAWERKFTQNSVNKSFYNGNYRDRRKELLFEGEKARFPETMPAVENYKNIQTWEAEKMKTTCEIDELREKLWKAQQEQRKLQRKIQNARTGHVGGEEKKEAKQFIRKCPADGCEGFLSSAWKCGVCSIWACPHCFAAKGFDKNAEHTCNPDDVASANLIKQETKGCPSCGTRIFKVSGCDQMWCTSCHVAFSWRTGMRVNGVIHNPHFYAFQQQGGAAVVQNPGAQICGGLPTYYQIRDRIRALRAHPIFRHMLTLNVRLPSRDKYTCYGTQYWEGMTNYIQSLHRGANHFQYTILDRIRGDCQQAQDNKQLRIKFICGEITEDKMKTTLLKRDTALEKKRALLNVYELMGAVYTEVAIDIHNAMLDALNDIGPRDMTGFRNLESADKLLVLGKARRVVKRIDDNVVKLDRVRVYSNVELCKISGIYNQGVSVIDEIYTTPNFNKEKCKKELNKKNAGELRVVMEQRQDGRWRIKYEEGNYRQPMYV